MLTLLFVLIFVALLLLSLLGPVSINDETHRTPPPMKPILWGQTEDGKTIVIYPPHK